MKPKWGYKDGATNPAAPLGQIIAEHLLTMNNMATNSNKVTIDFNVWQTQAQYAAEKKVRLGTVSQWVIREKEGIKNPKVEIFTIHQLGITLVKK